MPLDLDFSPQQGHVSQESGYLHFMPAPPLGYWIQNLWQLNVPLGKFSYRSVPDNCVDLIINLDSPEDMFVISPFSTPLVFDLVGPVSYFGIRFSILGHGGLIDLPVGEWGEDNEIPASELMAEDILDLIYGVVAAPLPFSARCENLCQLLSDTLVGLKIDPRLARYIRYCHANTSSRLVISDKQCATFGLSARQLRRLSRLHLGLSPREVARVFRFQSALKLINTSSKKLSWVDHYHDESHLHREFKNLSGLTPVQLTRLSVLYNID